MTDLKSHDVDGAETEKTCWQCGRTFTTTLEVCPDDGARLIETGLEDREDPLLGTVFDGRFRIYKKLGEGGMGSVYGARRLDFETDVALKLLKSDYARDDGIRKRFMYEARVISNLKHPHAVRLFDFGQTAEGHVYMVMELLDGESLADRLAYRFVTYREVFDIITPICGVLGEAHTRDVIHRDLKPENIYLLKVDGNSEFPKLLDFGIAKHNRVETMTKSGTLWGTPAYMSPEQARGDAVGAPADIYGIGIMIYELICGNLPFHASTQMGFAVKHINEPARPLSSIPGLESVPDELDEFISSMLAKDPEERPATMEEVASTLERVRDTYFDDELLDSIPAEEVDPIGLQGWMKDAPDISQTLPGEPRGRVVDALGVTAVSDKVSIDPALHPLDEGEARSRETQDTLLAPPNSDAGDGVDAVDDGKVVAESGEQEISGLEKAKPFIISGAVAGLFIVLGVWWLFAVVFADGVDPQDQRVVTEIPTAPVGSENVVGVATLQAAHVIFEARDVVRQINLAEGEEYDEELDDEFDFLHEPIRPSEARGGEESSSPNDDDARLREALEQTF